MKYKDRILKSVQQMGEGYHSLIKVEKELNVKTHNEKAMLKKLVFELVDEKKLFNNRRSVSAYKPKLIKGVLRGNARGFAFLIREDGGEDMFVPHRALKDAMHGDTVFAVQTGESEAEVHSVITTGITRLVGEIRLMSRGDGYVIPDNKDYFDSVFIPKSKLKGAMEGEKVVISVIKTNKGLDGEVLERLGERGKPKTEVLAILRSYNFSEKFPQEVLSAAQSISYEKKAGRKDFTSQMIVTIDGEDAKDFDDAISVSREEKGYRLFVHIADVSEYVRAQGILDKEALSRATSVYFPGNVFPMLPEVISNGVCSLSPGEEKLALTLEMLIDLDGKVIYFKPWESTIISKHRMTYNKVQSIFDGDIELKKEYEEAFPMLLNAKELAIILKARREREGGVNFISRESKIEVDKEGNVLSVNYADYKTSNELIEMFMVAANEAAATFIEEKGVPSIYRLHEKPREEKMKDFVDFVHKLGISFNEYEEVTPKRLSEFLDSIKDESYAPVVSRVLLRSMQKAKYSERNGGHFGLALDSYCHFTSPIRRYPDLMAHRALKAIMRSEAENYKNYMIKRVPEIAAISSEREVAAERAEWDIQDYYKACYMEDKVGEKFTGTVSSAVSQGIYVALDNSVEGFISIKDLPDDRYASDGIYAMEGDRYSFKIGDRIDVEIAGADPVAREVTMIFSGDAKAHFRKGKRTEVKEKRGSDERRKKRK